MTNKNLIVVKPLITQAEDLAKEHELIHQQYVVPGRLALYGLLQKIMQLSEAFDASPDKDDLIKFMRIKLQESRIKTQDNTPADAVLVRFVTRADRKAAHVYARAIETAKANGVPSTDFIKFVQEQGGIERIRSNAANPKPAALSEQEARDVREAMWEFLRLRSEMPFARFKPSRGTLPGDRGPGVLQYLIASRNGDEYRVISALEVDDELEHKLLAPLQKAVAERMAKDKNALDKMRQAVDRIKNRSDELQDAPAGDGKCAA